MEEILFRVFVAIKRVFGIGRKVEWAETIPGNLSPAFGRLLGYGPSKAQQDRYVNYLATMADSDQLLQLRATFCNRRQSLLVRFPELRNERYDHPQRPNLQNLDRRIALLTEANLRCRKNSGDIPVREVTRFRGMKPIVEIEKIDTVPPLVLPESGEG